MRSQVKSIHDVRLFFNDLIKEGTIIHPDDDFKNVVERKTGKATYSKSEIQVRNDLMRESFRICKEEKIDIHDLAASVTLRKTGLKKLIPVPESFFIS